MKWTGYNIEPTPSTFETLQKNRKNSTNIRLALSDRCGTISFAITESVKQNIKYQGAVNHIIYCNNSKIGDIFSVAGNQYIIKNIIDIPCITWAKLIDNFAIQRVDLFILDTEGSEGEILDGMQGCQVLPYIICIENGWREDIRHRLDNLGYIYDISHFENHMYIRKDLLSLFALRAIHKNY